MDRGQSACALIALLLVGRFSSTFATTDVRLAGGFSSRRGRVEVRLSNGTWGTVCDDAWDLLDANVVCRQLGFSKATAANLHYGTGDGPILLDQLDCTGQESDLFQCQGNAVGVHDCSHAEDAGVDCANGDVRLVGGPSEMRGRVEVRRYGVWGTVCDDYWDKSDGNVVCRQLGFSQAVATIQTFGGGSGRIFLSNLRCTGSESNLFECPNIHSAAGYGGCSHYEDAGVECVKLSTCGAPPSSSLGSTNFTTSTPGSIALITCNGGYTYRGKQPYRLCSSYGMWSDPVGDCEHRCGPRHAGVNANVAYSTSVYTRYVCWNNATYVTGSRISRCNSSTGQWSGAPYVCQDKDCGTPPAGVKATVEYTTTRVNATASFKCHPHTRRSWGDTQLVCTERSYWRGTTLRCEDILCSRSPTIPQGTASIGGRTIGSVAAIRCDEGYTLNVTDPTLRCENTSSVSASWTGPDARCLPEPPGMIINATGADITVTVQHALRRPNILQYCIVMTPLTPLAEHSNETCQEEPSVVVRRLDTNDVMQLRAYVTTDDNETSEESRGVFVYPEISEPSPDTSPHTSKSSSSAEAGATTTTLNKQNIPSAILVAIVLLVVLVVLFAVTTVVFWRRFRTERERASSKASGWVDSNPLQPIVDSQPEGDTRLFVDANTGTSGQRQRQEGDTNVYTNGASDGNVGRGQEYEDCEPVQIGGDPRWSFADPCLTLNGDMNACSGLKAPRRQSASPERYTRGQGASVFTQRSKETSKDETIANEPYYQSPRPAEEYVQHEPEMRQCLPQGEFSVLPDRQLDEDEPMYVNRPL
ncbi:deleted in malignant brain tumors 1 protein-like [Sycon ciliatum]|uniref:deleted in malignant brain tumors 1 protein-like n=1 Tax=Sycon ciliatum TaxID=27933 RepID=UPI0031F6BC23